MKRRDASTALARLLRSYFLEHLKLERRELTYLVALGNAHAVSREWDLVADTIALDVNQRKLEQTLAWGTRVRPTATSPGRKPFIARQ